MASTEVCKAEKDVFEKIANNDASGLKTLLLQNEIKPDILDENGMTPLQHAAYKGNTEIAQMLLDQGADVNSGSHDHGYTALHFAALSGNAELCQLLLMAGAKKDAVNSVNRTAAQMAGFVGNHNCVAVINNHVPKADIEYFTVPRGILEKEPKLPPALATPLHKFVMQVNMHPVRIALNLQKLPSLCGSLDRVQKVLQLMSEREMKSGPRTNEVMAFKFHYLSFVVAEVASCAKRQQALQERKSQAQSAEKDGEEKRSDPVELFVRKMLKSSRADPSATPEFQESFMRECVREFPFRECTVFRQMVSTLAQKDSPPAVSVVSGVISGQRASAEQDQAACCFACGQEGAPKKCSKCRAVQYCDRECQRLHWFVHKKVCARPSGKAAACPSPLPSLQSLEVK
ncbi:ankyrin repeat and MYND domain-containing protein 2 isoform X2 [Bacillus rossius redtenbacheri]|uniref:ankyrin repeat and MYND domain-containing protein 2 isoform X2 n=1 Tax=Bacillus rossius redtenbacheri TaxID=93214 RepID=UPI002FDDBBCE